MKYKIPYKKGFTLIELVLAIVVLMIFTSTIVLNIRAGETKKKARDNIRLSDIAVIERVVNEYFLDNMQYPGVAGAVYVSTFVNWIPVDLSEYISMLPIDPLNEGGNMYFYTHNGSSYEINTTLEYFSDLSSKDNGDNALLYEVGNNLSLITDLP